ncbi:MAG: glycine--tRNA ligase subunit alpha [Candidatus Eisenbacteria bacterium]|uniref:Glycine--tRNA ligase alpha subunit n=1 Tax=Eiseniibacteriota bacterium TaxID=2212470 RepID=A0A538T3N9_UNCEI|nr:MAG: glycine--tRNA ligase subunit alpha [Candidatus Eisenbacteria bacterium]
MNPKQKIEPPASFQEMLLRLEQFWSGYGCALVQPYSSEVGAGTFNPATFFRVLGPEPWKAAYVEPSRRPKDGRYGQNPNRLQMFYQYQVVLKPSPPDVLDVYLESLRHIGIDLERHDVRLVEDDWESPTLGAWGLGWEVWLDGQEITQFTYFQQSGGYDLDPISAEITYGIERIACYLQGVDRIMDLRWSRDIRWDELFLRGEVEWSTFNFEQSNPELLFEQFEKMEREAERLLEAGLVLPGYDYVIKCSHLFNLLEARGAISVTERVGTIARVRKLARRAAGAFLKQREEMGYPLLRDRPAPAELAGAARG